MSTTFVTSLPHPLLLLIHLHILEYPDLSNPEYDPNIFDPRVRGLMERTKVLEDIGYFLVGKVDGGAGAKAILSTYPCLVPSDTIAFRTSLAKYLEGLRHNSVYPKAVNANGPKTKGKEKENAKTKTKTPEIVAWWWKDIVVRKSLLEECAGERFERLILALSTHALFKSSSPPISISIDISHTLLTQPITYTSLLHESTHARHAWARSAAGLRAREVDLHTLRDRLGRRTRTQVQDGEVSTSRLVVRVETMYQDLLRGSWSEKALEILMRALGVKRPPPVTSKPTHDRDASLEPKDLIPKALQGTQPQPQPRPQPQPLPIAAAHHPAHLGKLRRPVLPTTTFNTSTAATSTELRPQLPADLTPAREARTCQALSEALGRVRAVGRELAERERERVRMREGKRGRGLKGKSVSLPKKKSAGPAREALVFDLWEPKPSPRDVVDFDTKPTPALLASFGFKGEEEEGGEGGLEKRIEEVRRGLPEWGVRCSELAPREPHSELELPARKGETRIPRAPKGKEENVVSTTIIPPRPAREHALAGDNIKPATRKEKEKTKPRKSIRASLAHAQRRPSLFPTFCEEDEDEDEVHEMIRSVADTSTDEEPHINLNTNHTNNDTNADADTTPTRTTKAKVKVKVNRIFTGSKTRTRRTKASFPGALAEPVVPLPLPRPASESGDFESEGVFGEEQGEGAEEYADAGSMTLRDILLSAGDVSGFQGCALLELDEGELVGDGDGGGWE